MKINGVEVSLNIDLTAELLFNCFEERSQCKLTDITVDDFLPAAHYLSRNLDQIIKKKDKRTNSLEQKEK